MSLRPAWPTNLVPGQPGHTEKPHRETLSQIERKEETEGGREIGREERGVGRERRKEGEGQGKGEVTLIPIVQIRTLLSYTWPSAQGYL